MRCFPRNHKANHISSPAAQPSEPAVVSHDGQYLRKREGLGSGTVGRQGCGRRVRSSGASARWSPLVQPQQGGAGMPSLALARSSILPPTNSKIPRRAGRSCSLPASVKPGVGSSLPLPTLPFAKPSRSSFRLCAPSSRSLRFFLLRFRPVGDIFV